MQLAEMNSSERKIKSGSKIFDDDTSYLFSNPETACDILEGLSTSWDECISEAACMIK